MILLMSCMIGQSIMMALTVTVNKYASSNVQAVHRKQPPKSKSNSNFDFGRRGLLLSTLIAAATQVPDSRTQLLQKYLKKTEENKEKNEKERLESYYRRNYKDYFEYIEGGLRGREFEGTLTEAEKGILDWLQTNK